MSLDKLKLEIDLTLDKRHCKAILPGLMQQAKLLELDEQKELAEYFATRYEQAAETNKLYDAVFEGAAK